ncbi:MAG: DoxX family protein [Rhodococcus sp. (in: high G+C Gram-positive bacteria)]
MRALGLPVLHKFGFLAPLALRVGVGIVFLVHGLSKLENGPATAFSGMLTGLSVPAPTLFAWLVTIAELVGGIMLIAGLLTRLVTLPLIATMIGAIFLVKIDVGIIADMGAGAELDIALLAGLVALLVMGPGRLSIDSMVGIEAGRSQEVSAH